MCQHFSGHINVERLFFAIREQAYPLAIAVYNVDSNIAAPLLEISSETFTRKHRKAPSL
jgi:hypothetical protein